REAVEGVVVVGRIGEHEVVRGAIGRKRAERVLAEDGRVQLQLVEVRVDRAARLAVGVDERRARGAARERLESERARAGEEVEYARLVDGADQVEGRLADEVRRRPRRQPLWRGDPVALLVTGDDPHAAS